MKKALLIIPLLLSVSCTNTDDVYTNTKIKALIIDGQNNHTVWPKSTVMMKQYFEQSGLFEVSVYRTKPTWKKSPHSAYYNMHSDDTNIAVKKPITDPNFAPKFSDYDVVISNMGFNAAPLSRATEIAFEKYMKNGGGFVAVHSANNSFPNWIEYNKMVGLSGWGNRNESNGPYLYYDESGNLVTEHKKGKAGTHGNKHEFIITERNEHIIVNGLPDTWLHTKDECYGRLRGPAENMTILASALCPKSEKGTGKNEPMLMTISYGEGRIFHTTLGHDDDAFESVGFITTLLRGTEWAGTGTVTQKVPKDFPTAKSSSKRIFILNTD